MQDAVVEVVSRFGNQQMTFPLARPSSAVCELSQHRDSSGSATVLYGVLRARTITFFSGYTHITPAMDPAMLGRVTVTRATSTS
ncbi:MAG: hypothetical protein ACLP0J_11575 [Solirubrobacteraceae bacterium]